MNDTKELPRVTPEEYTKLKEHAELLEMINESHEKAEANLRAQVETLYNVIERLWLCER